MHISFRLAWCTAVATSGLWAQVDLVERGKVIHFGNDMIELRLNSSSGYFLGIRNKQTGAEHKPPDDGVWPFGLWAGTRENPEQMKAEIRADAAQKMNFQLERGKPASILRLTYPMLTDNATGKPTGVGLGVEIELSRNQTYFIVRAEIANGGPLWVTNFYAGRGKLLTGDTNPDKERVHIPTRGGFERANFKGRSLGAPTYVWGWSDYSGRKGGIGVGYVNGSGIQWMFDIQPEADGLMQSWRLFNTRGYWHFESRMNEYQKSLLIQPLEPANSFNTGEWLIVPHAGDWHQTADAYRQRYLKVFAGDYLSWEALPEKAKKAQVQLGLFIAENSIGNSYPRKVVTPLDQVIPTVDRAMKAVGWDAARTGVHLVFFHPNVGRYPEFFPVWEPVGGDRGMKTVTEQLHQMGFGYVMGYAHLSYNHRAAKNYVLDADPQDTIPPINPTAGHRACIDNSAWVRLWKDEIIPAYKERGFDSVFADEGHFPWGTCSLSGPAHLHGNTAVGILTGNTRGAIRLHKVFREVMGPETIIHVEGSGDVAGRWVEMSHAYPDPAVAYTLPFKRFAWFLDALTPDPKLSEKVNLTLAHGYVLMVNLQVGKDISGVDALRRYVAVRRRLEQERAPGYPYGFRDTVGLKWGSPLLEARAFQDPRAGLTVVYYASGPVDDQIEVDGAALGSPNIGVQRRRVKLDKDGVDFWVLRHGSAR